eukprot:4067039-Prymnesium_polylepis.1
MAIAEPTGIRPMEAPRACAMQCAGARARGASPLQHHSGHTPFWAQATTGSTEQVVALCVAFVT